LKPVPGTPQDVRSGVPESDAARKLQPARVSMKKWVRGWRLWVLAGIGVTGALLLLAQDQDTIRVQSPIAAEDPNFTDYVASLVGVPITSGDTFKVLRNGVEVFPPMLDAIRNAKTRISFETFIYEDGIVGDQFTQALADAARRGVTVRIVLDAIGGGLSSESRKELTDAGASVVTFNTIAPWTLEETNYRTHRKVVVIDGELAFTGGIGLADHWLGNADAEDHWRDTQIRITGPAVRALEASFWENWLESGGLTVPALDAEAPPQGSDAQTMVVWSNPTGGASRVKLLFLLALAGARHTIDIQSPYVLLDESTRWSLSDARGRGVRVRILTDGEVTDAKPVKYSSREGYQALLEQGIEIYEYEPTMMHVKALVVDGIFSLAGSANFDNRSFELNDELTIAVTDRTLAGDLLRDFEHDLSRSKQIRLEQWRNRGLLEKSREWFWGMFGEIF
jgi:cardiolipin synthase